MLASSNLCLWISSFLFDSLVTVLVGSEQHRFDIHKGLLCTKSGFFKTACDGNFKEADGTIRLPYQEVNTFKYFVYWLYTGNLSGFYYHDKISPSILELKIRVHEVLRGKGIKSWDGLKNYKEYPCITDFYLAKYRNLPFTGLIGLYVLADFLNVCGLKDMILTALVKVYHSPHNPRQKKGTEYFYLQHCRYSIIPFWDHDVERTQWCPDPAKGINLAWETFGKDNPLCKVLVKLFGDGCKTVAPFPQGDILNASFVTAAYERLLKRYNTSDNITAWENEGVMCRYHSHDAGCPLDASKIDDEIFPEIPV